MSRRLRILMTVDAVGGVWQYALELARALTPLGHDVVLALLGPEASPRQQTEVNGIAGVHLIDTGLPLDWLAPDERAVRGTAGVIGTIARQARADVIQLNQPALASEPMPVPAVVVAHSCVATWWRAVETREMPAALGWQARLTRDGLLAGHPVVATSAAFAAALQSAYRLPLPPTVVHNSRTAPPAALARQPCDFAFTAGRLWDRGKNLATLDQAAARLGVPLRAAGPVSGPNGEAITLAHIETSGILGDGALAAVLAARPVFVSAALYEPFGLAVLEAALAGCALVLSDIPTFRELWGNVASFIAPRDADGFAAAIEALIADPERRLAAGEAARRHAAHFTPGAMGTRMAAIYTLAAPLNRVAA